MSANRYVAIAVCVVLSACAVGPDYKKPAISIPKEFKEAAQWKLAEPKDELPRGNWWEIFADSKLNELETQLEAANQTIRAATERVAINAPIQGTAADMIKIAMVKVHSALRAGGFETRMLLHVHDELLFEVPKNEVERVTPVIVKCMKEALPLRVPVLVETGTGKNWLQAH